MKSIVPVVVLVLVTAACADAALTVALRQEATVDAGRITLADVAEFTGEPATLATRLGAIALGRAPAPGAAREITRQFLRTRLRQERIDLRAVHLEGAHAVRVTRRATCVPGITIAQAAAAHVRATLPWPDDDLVVEVQRAPADIHLLGSADGLRYTAVPRPGQRLLGQVPVAVAIHRGTQVVGRASVLLHVRVFQRLVVARRRIRAGERITKDHVRLQRTELTGVATEAIADLADALGQEARRDIAAFAVLTRRMAGPARVMRRGEPVMLLARTARIRVTARGIAEQDGAVGQFIRVRNKDSRKTVLGRVLDARTVEVSF